MVSVLPEAIFVPQGSEYQAVCRGLKKAGVHLPIYAIPIGQKPTARFIKTWLEDGSHPRPRSLLLLGLGGSLQPKYQVGDVVLYDRCNQVACDEVLTDAIARRLSNCSFRRVRGYTCDRFLATAAEKQHLGQQANADVADMEGITLLEHLPRAGIAVAMLRVISDDANHDLSDLNGTIDAEGHLRPRSLALSLLRQPLRATRLIQGALRGLKVLQDVTHCLFREP
jgi:nucleoside phosphorylase